MPVNYVDYGLVFNDLQIRKETNYIILHHPEWYKCSVVDIDRDHKGRGWEGIAYNALVRKNGSVERGRPLDTIGAHTKDHNWESLGLCFEGNFHPSATQPVDYEMTDLQFNAGVEVIREWIGLYPNAKVVGHNFFGGTECPGKYFPLDRIIAEVNNQSLIYRDFSLVSPYAQEAVTKLKELGIMVGDNTGHFWPKQNITREDFASVVYRLIQKGGIKL